MMATEIFNGTFLTKRQEDGKRQKSENKSFPDVVFCRILS